VVINEIHYEPPDETKQEEFLELYNAGGDADLSGWSISDGISYTFPAGTLLGAGQYLVVAENPAALIARFGPMNALGPYQGYLSNDGERLVLRNGQGLKVDEVDYRLGFPWPLASGGDGSSMELINPGLDNDLGGSWRASTGPPDLGPERLYLLTAQDPAWRYRKGTSEASTPASLWRAVDFVEDASWATGQTSIGFGDSDEKTLLDDMLNGYMSVYLRHPFMVDTIPPALKLRVFVDDGCIAWINGFEVARLHVSKGDKTYNTAAGSHEAVWEEITLPDPRQYLVAGQNLLAIHAMNNGLTSNDFSIDAELLVPRRDEMPPAPTPGRRNSVWSENAPPQIRQVSHGESGPFSGAPIIVTAKVTDPLGVASVSLSYQVVRPGSYIPARLAIEPPELMAAPSRVPPLNPAFEDPVNWSPIPMLDDGTGADEERGDGIYTAVIPGQPNRTLVRYRITAADTASASVTVPYPDDESLNFACFVYDGVPSYKTTRATVHPEGVGYTYPPTVMISLPVYILITRTEEVARCIAYNPAWQIPKGNEAARDAFNWEGAFVYEGVVYDHIHYRLRQANDRYGGIGKRSWRFRFNRGYPFRARDDYGREYPTRWRTLDTGKMFDNKGVGNFGLTETLNSVLWNLVGVPAPFMHTFHFRVVDGPDEAPAGTNGQYYGDFWGMALAMEDYDPHFLDAHGMPDGNLYKLKDGIFDGNQLKRNQGRYAVTTDADFQNIRANLRPEQTSNWLNTYVNYDRWYPYHAVVEGIRHYDFVPADSHSKNRAWFFEPDPRIPLGRLWTLPYDSDASWGPNWNNGIDYSMNAIYGGAGKPEFKIAYRSVLREFRDLVWQRAVLEPEIDELASLIKEFAKADRDRWKGAPADAGSQDFGTLEAKVADMKNFAFVSWSGATGPAVGPGGRAKYLEDLANAEGDAAAIPRTPTVTAVGPAHFPIDSLVFETTPFSDPQGAGTFGLLRWRVTLVKDPDDPFPRILDEWTAVWETETAFFDPRVTIPLGAIAPGRTYRVRARMMDSTKRWSHWSEPVEFLASEPDGPIPQRDSLRITEVMYNPTANGDLEFVELENIGPHPVDLSGVRLEGGIEFAFTGGAVTRLDPADFVVVVKNRALFESAHDTRTMKIAGEFAGKLSNAGDAIVLRYGQSAVIQSFSFQDAWYPETDGAGHSLVTADPRGALELWGQKEGWRSSAASGGSPGAADPAVLQAGLQIPGDLNQDRLLDLGDAIGSLVLLFLDPSAVLPCGNGTLSDPANVSLLDASGDGSVDLTDTVHTLGYLFLGGPPPVLGEGCTEIPGCRDRCGK
jgi:lamin tail-like protein/CotH protein